MLFVAGETARGEVDSHDLRKALAGAGLTVLALVGVECNVAHSLVVWIRGGQFSEAVVVPCVSDAGGEGEAASGHSQPLADFSVARPRLHGGVSVVDDDTPPRLQSPLTFSHALLPSA